MLAEVVHLHLGDEEASRERFVYEQQEAFDAAAQREHQRTELEEIAGSLRAELTTQAEQHLNHFLQQEQACFTSHLRNVVESHLQAEVANTKFHLGSCGESSSIRECLCSTAQRATGAKKSTPRKSSSTPGGRLSPPGAIRRTCQSTPARVAGSSTPKSAGLRIWHSLSANYPKGESYPPEKFGRAS